MANAITVPLEIAAEMAMKKLLSAGMNFKIFSTDHSPANAFKGAVVKVKVYGTPEGASSTFAGDYEDAGDATVTNVDVTLSEHLFQTFALDDTEQAKLGGGVPLELVETHAIQLANDGIDFITDKILAAAFSAVAVDIDPTSFDSDVLSDLRLKAVQAKFKKGRYMCVLNPDYYTELTKDTTIVALQNSGQTGTLTEATLPRLKSFDIHELELLGNNGERLGGFITDGTGLAVATTVIIPGDDADMVIEHVIVEDPISKLRLGMRKHYSAKTGKTYVTSELVLGASVGIATGLERITDPA